MSAGAIVAVVLASISLGMVLGALIDTHTKN